MQEITPHNEINLSSLSCRWESKRQEKNEITSLAERVLIPFLDFSVSFFNLKDVNAFGQVNHAFHRKFTHDFKKYPYIEATPISFLIAFNIKQLFYNTEKHPMGKCQLKKLFKKAEELGLKVTPYSYIHYYESGLNDISFSKFQALHTLEMYQFPLVVSAKLACLAETLHSLSISIPSNNSDACYKALGQLYRLKSLKLCFVNQITNVCLNAILCLSNLERLEFRSCTMVSANLDRLSRLSKLCTVIFNNCDKLYVDNMLQLAHMNSLQNLSFLYCFQSIVDICKLNKFINLKKLIILNKEIKNEELFFLNNLNNLQYLSLARCSQISGSGLVQLKGLKALQLLNIKFIGIDEDQLYDLWNHLPALKAVYRGHSRNISLPERLPNTISYMPNFGIYVKEVPLSEEAVGRWLNLFENEI